VAAVLARWEEFFNAREINVRPAIGRGIIVFSWAAWIILCGFTTLTTIPMWKNDAQMWMWTYNRHPEIRFVEENYLGAMLADNRQDLVRKALDKQLSQGKKLDWYPMAMYASTLFLQGDIEEAGNYFDGVVSALKTAPIAGVGVRTSQVGLLDPRKVVSVYTMYSIFKLKAKGDVDTAITYTQKALQHSNPASRLPLVYKLAMLYYVSGQFNKGWEIALENENKIFPEKQKYIQLEKNNAMTYCDLLKNEKFHGNQRACDRLIAAGFFDKAKPMFFGPID